MKLIKSKLAFSLIELSIVILIIGVLVIGITQGSRIIRNAKLRSAQSLTISSTVNSVDGLLMWFETTLDKSFIDAERVSTTLGDAGTISTWNDINSQSTTLNNATQVTANDRPRYTANLMSGLPALNFDGATEFMIFNGKPLANSNYTFFIVEQRRSGEDFNWMIGGNTAGINNDSLFLGYRNNDSIRNFQWGNECTTSTAAYTTPKPKVHTFTFNSFNGKKYYSNGIFQTFNLFPCAAPNTGLVSYNNAYIGNAIGEFFNGDIGEIIIFNKTVSDIDRSNIEKYLKQKWGIK